MFTLLTLEFLINKVKYAANHQNSLNYYNFILEIKYRYEKRARPF